MTSFSPTHHVPDGGMASWEAPDPAVPSQRLDQWLPVQVVETRGEWAHIACSNGWQTWVDARRLVLLPQGTAPAPSALAPSAPTAARAGGSVGARPVQSTTVAALAAGALIVAGSFMSWVEGAPFTSFDVKLLALFDETATTGPGLGWALLACALVVGLAPFVQGVRAFGALAAVGVLALIGLYVFRLAQFSSFGTAVSALGIGTWVTVGGGISGVIASTRRSKR